jgi:YVTN family beta-propeller protein
MVLAGLSIAAFPSLASARIAYFTGSSGGMGEIAAPVELSTQTASSANQVSLGVSSEGSPEDVAIAPDGKTAYVVSNEKVVPIDIATNKAGTAIPVPLFGQAIAITPDGRFAYVVSAFATDVVTKIDLATRAKVAEIPVGDNLFGVAVTPDGRTVYVVSSGDSSVYPVDVATNVVGSAIPVGSFPSAIAVTPDGTSAYVLRSGEGKLVRINVGTNTVAGSITGVSGGQLAITPSGAKAYVVGGTEATPVDLTAGVAGTTLVASTQGEFQDVAILPDGSSAYMTTQTFEASIPHGLMTPLATASEALQPTFPLNASFVQALAIVPNQPPHAAFSSSPSSPTPGSAVSFNAGGSTDSDGSVVRYDWNFGDGSSAANAGPTPSHTFAKGGTYQVTVTETDNEGCSVSLVFTGQTAYCNGSSVARATHPVTVGGCPKVVGGATSFVPKLRSSHVVPGVRVRLAVNAPAHLVVKSTLLWSREGHEGRAGLGRISVDVKHWRRIRLPIPAELRSSLPLGSKVRVNLEINAKPHDGSTCLGSISRPTLHVRVVKVIPQAVQFGRPR